MVPASIIFRRSPNGAHRIPRHRQLAIQLNHPPPAPKYLAQRSDLFVAKAALFTFVPRNGAGARAESLPEGERGKMLQKIQTVLSRMNGDQLVRAHKMLSALID